MSLALSDSDVVGDRKCDHESDHKRSNPPLFLLHVLVLQGAFIARRVGQAAYSVGRIFICVRSTGYLLKFFLRHDTICFH
jgi:hypothetical protein